MWRIHSRLDIGKGKILYPGSLSTLHWLDRKGLQRLEMKGSISKVSAPPLAILPGWILRAERLSSLGIEYVDQLIACDEKDLAEKAGLQERTILKWKDEVEQWLIADKEGHT